jgi:hypothetical protein
MLQTAVTPESTGGHYYLDPELLNDAIPLLRRRLKESIADKRLREAEAIKRRIAELQTKQQSAQREQLRDRQASERITVEAAHMSDYTEFNLRWDDAMTKYARECEAQLQDLKAAHERDIKKKTEELETTTPGGAKLSSELLNMKKKCETYVKVGMYIEAHDLTAKIEAREATERSAWEEQRQIQIRNKLRFFEERKRLELKALKAKLRKGNDELQRRRARELETVIKRYQNNAKQLGISQGIEKNKCDGRHTTLAGCSSLEVTSISRILASSRGGTPGVTYRPKHR